MAYAKNISLIIVLILMSLFAHANTFVVISNASSGPGTLREALTLAAANGSAVTDLITFNLPDQSEAGRTITITDQLPALSSNLVIDGSTQSGLVFGVSTAKVHITFNTTPQQYYYGLQGTDLTDIAFYGLYLEWTGPVNRTVIPSGIYLIRCNNITIGDVNKGNVISGFSYPLGINMDLTSTSTNIDLKANIMGVQADGETHQNEINLAIDNVFGRINIGGVSAQESNLLASGIDISYDFSSPTVTIDVRNNIIGVDYALTKAIASQGLTIGAGMISQSVFLDAAVSIEDNVISSNQGLGILIRYVSQPASILRNYINVDRNKNQLGSCVTGIYDQLCTQVSIGDNNTVDANYIGYCKRPVFAEDVGKMSMTKNSFFCSTGKTPVYFDFQNEKRTQC